MKKVIFAIPALAAASAFATSSGPALDASTVESATSALESWGITIIGGIGGVIAAVAGLRLLVKGVNRAVGK